jgi:hypothetical protein
LVVSSMMARSDGDPLRVVPTKKAPWLLPLGERLRPLKLSMMNSRNPKQIVLPREKPLHLRRSPSVVMMIFDV